MIVHVAVSLDIEIFHNIWDVDFFIVLCLPVHAIDNELSMRTHMGNFIIKVSIMFTYSNF